MTSKDVDAVTLPVEKVRAQVQAAASKGPRVLYTLCLLLDAGVLTVVVALWSTEPSLPMRTHAAFGALSVLGVVWLVFFCWVLLYRRPLYARDRVLAGKLALVCSTLFLVGGVAAAAQRGGWRGVAAVGVTGGVLVAGAGGLLWQGIRARRALLRRRGELLAQTDPDAGGHEH